MDLEHIETYSDKIPNEWVRFNPNTNSYILQHLYFDTNDKELKPQEAWSGAIGCDYVKFLIGIGDNPQDGIITEQLIAILIHRQEEFNKKLPSEQGTKIVELLKEVVRLTEERITDRKSRGVHGENEL